MLSLSRKKGERVKVFLPGQTEPVLTIVVDSIRGNRVTLGFAADKSVVILRGEVVDQAGGPFVKCIDCGEVKPKSEIVSRQPYCHDCY